MRSLLSADKPPLAPARGCKQHRFPTSKLAPFGSWARLYARLGSASSRDLTKLVEQRFRFLQVERAEALGEPAIDWREKVAGFGVTALVAAEPGETRGGAQFPELGPLLLSDGQGFAIQFLGGFGMPLLQAVTPLCVCLALPRASAPPSP
jgi:hypothetical protein